MKNEKRKLIIYLVRHAQTSGNVDMKIVAKESDVLTELGKVQANLLGMHLSEVQFDYAFSSDYGRALKTTKTILNQSKQGANLKVETHKLLREVNFGKYELASYKDTLAYCCSLHKPVLQWTFPGGESFPEAGKRILQFIEELNDMVLASNCEPSSTVLIVSHSMVIVNFLNCLHESTLHEVLGWDQNKDLKLMGNATYMKIEVELREPEKIAVEEEDFMHVNESLLLKTTLGTPLKFNFLEKHYFKHLQCIQFMAKKSNGVAKLANTKNGNQYLDCVQQ